MQNEMSIALAGDSPVEIRMAARLEQLARDHDLKSWTFTNVIAIVENGMPHSHPVLTLGTANVDNPTMALAEFLHEQLHWYEEQESEQRDLFIEATRVRYPVVPATRPEGCGDQTSTRLHLLVCHLEHRALEVLIGPDDARAVIATLAEHHYRWVYRTILRDKTAIRDLAARYGLLPPPLMQGTL